jgi:AAA15 family ATPase/GTPase
MLIEFALENFKSFRDLGVLSMEAISKESESDLYSRVIERNKSKILKAKAIYGANASGKSNLIMALVSFWKIVNGNLLDDNILAKFYNPYRLDNDTINEPTYFQIIFEDNQDKYRYGFEFDHKKIHSEWLFLKRKPETQINSDGKTSYKITKEVCLFDRKGQDFVDLNSSGFKEGKILKQGIKMFTERTLAVAVLDQLNSPISSSIRDFVAKNISISANLPKQTDNIWHGQTISLIDSSEEFKNWMTSLLKEVDPSILTSMIEDFIGPDGTVIKVPIIVRKGTDRVSQFLLAKEEAAGTNKIFDYGSVIYRSLTEGKTLIFDEMDALLHPKLTRKIIELFQSPDAHEDAQLIFATHDTNLMDKSLLRRDQICFINKSNESESEIFDLSDIKGVRVDDLFEKNYLKGNYGALPYLNNLEKALLHGK